MSIATMSSGSASAWTGKSIVDPTAPEPRGQTVFNNNLGAVHTVAGLNDNQIEGAVQLLINRGTSAIILAAQDTAAAAKDRFTTRILLPAGGKVWAYYNGTRWEPFSDTPGSIVTQAVLFTENATNTIHTGSVVLPAGSILHDIQVTSSVLWGAGSATMKVGDAVDDDGWFTGVNLKATDLLVGEVLKMSDSGAWGGKDGAYLTSAGRRGPTSDNFGPYIAAGASVIGVVTVGTPGSTAGRTIMAVSYSVPTPAAAVATGP